MTTARLHRTPLMVFALALLAGWAWAGPDVEPEDLEKNDAKPAEGIAPLQWLDYGDALDKALAEDKHIIIDFYTDWCGWCKVMDKKTYANPKVMKLLNESFVITKINAESNQRFRVGDGDMSGRELARMYRVQSFPMTWFLKPDGSPLANVPGYIDANKFMRALEYVNARSYEDQAGE